MQMQKAMLQPRIDYFKMVHSVTRRHVDQMPDDKIDYKPTPEVRSFSETVQHMYGFLDSTMNTIATGQASDVTTGVVKSKADLLAFVDKMFTSAMETWNGVTDAQLNTEVEAYGQKFPAFQFPLFAIDEHWHHRGALTIYLRMNGITPIMIYDYQH